MVMTAFKRNETPADWLELSNEANVSSRLANRINLAVETRARCKQHKKKRRTHPVVQIIASTPRNIFKKLNKGTAQRKLSSHAMTLKCLWL